MLNKFILFAIMLLDAFASVASDYRFVVGKGLVAQWELTDITGITTGVPNSKGKTSQMAYPVVSVNSNDNSFATINAIGYKLSGNSTYYSYFPFRWYDDFNPSAIACRYDGQCQQGNDNSAGLSACDLCISTINTTTPSDFIAEYKHIGSVLRITCPSPADLTMSSVAITAEADVIPSCVSVNLLTQQPAYSEYRNSITMKLDNVVLVQDEPMIFYVMMPSIDLSKQQLTVEFTDSKGDVYSLTPFTGPDMLAGRLYDVVFYDDDSKMKDISRSKDSSIQSLEYPAVHIADFPIDASFDGYIKNNISTAVKSINSSVKTQSQYSASGMMLPHSQTGMIITRDANGKVMKQLTK